MHEAIGERPWRGALALALAAAAIAAPTASGVLHPVVYGKTFTVSGLVPSGNPGEQVQILARPFNQAKFARVATVQTTANGNWTYTARPGVTTTYTAVWKNDMTVSVRADVMPRLDLTLRQKILTVTARTANPLRGHSVVVQLRQPGKAWHDVRTIVLGASSSAKVPFTAPRGRSDIRLYMSTQQAGAGYIAGVSGVLVYRNGA